MIDTVIAFMVIAAATAEIAFVARFLRLPWYRTPEGRMLMAKDVVLSLVLMLAVIGTFIPELPGRNIIRVVTWTAIATVFWWKTILFYRRQAEGERIRREKVADALLSTQEVHHDDNR